jgi:hypothetical protein
MFKTLMIHPDNTQLMDKAVKLVQTNQWTNFGNRATKVGSIPGSFLTAMTGLPMKIYFSPYAACAVIFLFHLISYFLLRRIGFLVHENFSVLLLGSFFWLNPWRVEQSELYNPAYLFLFSTAHLYTALKMKQKSFWLTFFHVVMIGLCFQTHFSFIILAFISLGLFLTKQIKISWRGFALGSGLMMLSLVPYLMDRFSNIGVEQNLDFTKSDAFIGRNFVFIYPVVKAMGYFFRMGSVYFGRHIFSEIQFEWILNESVRWFVSSVFHVLKWVLAAVTLLFSIFAIGTAFKNYPYREKFRMNQRLEENIENRFLNYFAVMFVAVFISASLSPVEFNHWHFILCFPAISLFMIFAVQKYNLQHNWIYSLVVLFIVWNIFASLGSRSHSFKNDYERDFYRHYQVQRSSPVENEVK